MKKDQEKKAICVYKIHNRPWKGIKGWCLALLLLCFIWVLTLRYQNCWHNGRQFLIVQLVFSWQWVKDETQTHRKTYIFCYDCHWQWKSRTLTHPKKETKHTAIPASERLWLFFKVWVWPLFSNMAFCILPHCSIHSLSDIPFREFQWMPAAGKLSQQPNNAQVQKRAQDSCLQAWQALGLLQRWFQSINLWKTATLCLFYSSSPHPQQPIWSAVGLTGN